MAFSGNETHYCIGANLTGMEIKLIFNEIADIVPDIAKLAEPQRLRSGWINGVKDRMMAALQNPYVAAKAIGTAALLSDGRVELGLGVGWCAEEFELLGARFANRGKRTEEMIELMRALWSPGWTEFDGEFYQTPRLEMSPAAPPIPIWVGGLSDVALRRAARYDGWVGDGAISAAQQLHGHRAENGLPADGFAVLAPLFDAFTPADYERAERGGVTHILTMPWMFYSGPDATLAEKVDGMKRFRRDQGLDG